MAVLEAVRGWDALMPPHVANEATEASEASPSPSAEPEREDDQWNEDRIRNLGTADTLAALLDYERHIGSTEDDFSQVCECIIRCSPHASCPRVLVFSIENYIPDSLMPLYESVKSGLLGTLRSIGILNTAAIRTTGGEHISPIQRCPRLMSLPTAEVDKHRSAHHSALEILRRSEDQLKQDEGNLKKLFDPLYFGKKGEWKKLEETCIEKDIGE